MPASSNTDALTVSYLRNRRSSAEVVAMGLVERHARAHERVHVAQCERWGIAFVPAYLAASAVVWLRGEDAYLDNPFERAAYGATPGSRAGVRA